MPIEQQRPESVCTPADGTFMGYPRLKGGATLQEIQYSSPHSIEEAVSILSAAGKGGRVLAGGTDLLVKLKNGAREIRHVVDIKRIAGLDSVQHLADGGLRIGAALSCARLGEDPVVRAIYPGLREAAMLIGSDQIQNRATLAGNLCNASPAADTTPALMVLGASCEIQGPEGPRLVPLADFVDSPGNNQLRPGEILIGIVIPGPSGRFADAYLRFIPRNEMDIAVVGVAAALSVNASGQCTQARVALGAVGPRVIEATEAAAHLLGSTLDEETLEQAAALARAVARPISDKRGPAEYRRSLVGTLTRRAIRAAANRANSREDS